MSELSERAMISRYTHSNFLAKLAKTIQKYARIGVSDVMMIKTIQKEVK